MFFLIPEDKRVLFLYIGIILLGVVLEHFHILSTEKTIAIGVLIVLFIVLIRTFKSN